MTDKLNKESLECNIRTYEDVLQDMEDEENTEVFVNHEPWCRINLKGFLEPSQVKEIKTHIKKALYAKLEELKTQYELL